MSTFLDRIRAADPERHARRLAPAGAVLCLIGVALANLLGLGLALFGLTLLLVSCLSRENGLLVFGPFARWELVRAARHKRPPALWRAVYATAVFALLGLVYLHVQIEYGWYTRDERMEMVAVKFFSGFVLCQFVFLAGLTVRLVAPVVAEERERKQLDFLLVTDLRNREILFGKAAGRLPQLLDPLLASLPVLALIPLFGGVPPGFVVAAVVATLSTVLALAGVSFYCSVKCENRDHAYGMTIGTCMAYLFLPSLLWLLALVPAAFTFPTSVGLASPVEVGDVVRAINVGNPLAWAVRTEAAIERGADPQTAILAAARWYSVFQIGVCALFGLLAAARLRHAEVWPMKPLPKVPKDDGGEPKPPFVRPPITDDCVAWHMQFRMMRFAKLPRPWAQFLRPFLWGVGFVAVFHLVPVFWSRASEDTVKLLVAGITCVFCAMVPLFGAMASAECIPRERKAGTLEALMLTGLGCREILRQKWRGCVLQDTGLLHMMLGILAAGLVTGTIHPLTAVVLLFILPVHAALGASYGLAQGVRAKTLDKAAEAMFRGLLLPLIAGLLLVAGTQALTDGTSGELGVAVAAAVFPPAASGGVILAPELGNRYSWQMPVPMVLAAAVAGALLYGRVAVWLFEVAVRRFEREWESPDWKSTPPAP